MGMIVGTASTAAGWVDCTASAAGLAVFSTPGVIISAAAGVFIGVGAAVDAADGVTGSGAGLIIRLTLESSLDNGDSRRWESPYTRSKYTSIAIEGTAGGSILELSGGAAAATAVFWSLLGSGSVCVVAGAGAVVAVLSVITVDPDAAAGAFTLATALTAAAGSNPASARALYMATALYVYFSRVCWNRYQ